MVDSEHLQIAQIALSERRAPSGRPVDVFSSVVMPLHPCQRRSRKHASPPAGLKFVSKMRVFRRFECSSGSTVQRGTRDTVLTVNTGTRC